MKKPIEPEQKNPEIQALENRILLLEEAVSLCLNMLKTWEDVSRKMLYPHQHNTCALTKEVITKVEEVL